MESNTAQPNPVNQERRDLALPDVKAQQEWLTPQMRQELGLAPNQYVPVRRMGYGLDNNIDDMNQGWHGDKTATPYNGMLTATQINNATVAAHAKVILQNPGKVTALLHIKKGVMSKVIFPQGPLMYKGNEEEKFNADGLMLLNSTFQSIAKLPLTNTIPNGSYIFAIDEHLELRILPAGHDNRTVDSLCLSYLLQDVIHNPDRGQTHNMLFGGKNVLIAGELTIKDGKIVRISNGSGHYAPHAWSLYYAVKPYFIKNPEVFSPNFEIEYRDKDMQWSTTPWTEFDAMKPWKNETATEFKKVIDDLTKDNYTLWAERFREPPSEEDIAATEKFLGRKYDREFNDKLHTTPH